MSKKVKSSTPTKPHQNRTYPDSISTPSPPPTTRTWDESSSSSIKVELRQRLETFLNLRREWDEVVLSRGLVFARKIVEIENEIEATFQHARFVQGCEENDVKLVDGYTWKQWCKLTEHKIKLSTALTEMAKLYESLQDVNNDLEKLVQTACRLNGIKHTFDIPVWTTWSLPRFCDHVLDLSVPFSDSLTLYTTLENVINSEEIGLEEKQAALSYWACQPLLPDVSDLKGILSVEIPDLFDGDDLTPRKFSSSTRNPLPTRTVMR